MSEPSGNKYGGKNDLELESFHLTVEVDSELGHKRKKSNDSR